MFEEPIDAGIAVEVCLGEKEGDFILPLPEPRLEFRPCGPGATPVRLVDHHAIRHGGAGEAWP